MNERLVVTAFTNKSTALLFSLWPRAISRKKIYCLTSSNKKIILYFHQMSLMLLFPGGLKASDWIP
jgi:hypothetical protein